MPVDPNIYGEAYLDAENFRLSAAMFGAGMSLCDYPDDDGGNAKLNLVLAAASRVIDRHCQRDFSPNPRSETQAFDLDTWRFSVNNPPVSEIVAVALRYGADAAEPFTTSQIFINNQKNYLEILRIIGGAFTIISQVGSELSEPVIEITYKSYADVPSTVKLATGFQAGHLMNTGFVDKTLPPNFGKLNMGGLDINNKKGYKSPEEVDAGSLSPDARRLLAGEIKFSAA